MTQIDPDHAHRRGLLLVAVYKLGKTVFFGLVGVLCLKLLHQNLGDLVMRLTETIPLDPQGKLVGMLMDKADLIGNHQLRLLALGSISYSCLCLVEGIGLLREKVWAQYVTVVATAIFLPWELYECYRDLNAWKVFITLGNIAVVLYLVWLLRRARAGK